MCLLIETVPQMNDVAHGPVVIGLTLLTVTHDPWVILINSRELAY